MYHLVYLLLYLVSLLPFRVLYIISDFLYLILYYIIRYRRDVVMKNLGIAFPEKTEKEKTAIAKAFYRNFIDNFIETLKLLSISEKELEKRFITDHETMNAYYASGKNMQIHLGHFFNWEMANVAYARKSVYPFLVVYMPIKNAIFERMFIRLRTRFNTILIAATKFRNQFSAHARNRYTLVLVADQTPAVPEGGYWMPFFNRPTAFVKGPEKGARLNNTVILFCSIIPVKRGYYTTKFHEITTEPRTMPDGSITKTLAHFIEEEIRKHPSNYLWSHKRWKHEWKEEYKDLWVG